MKRKRNNDGFSLVELIVAVLILGIVSSAAVVSMKSVYDSKVDSAAKVFGTVIKQARTLAMGKTNDISESVGISDVFAVFYYKDGNCYGEVYETKHNYTTDPLNPGAAPVDNPTYERLVSEKVISGSSISMKWWNHNNESNKHTLTNNEYIRVYFKKGTGGILKIYKTDDLTEGNKSVLCADDDDFADSVEFKNNTETIELILVDETGKCYYNK